MRGYTLIELLITISITTILITIGVNAYRKANDIQSIKSQTEKILTTLSQAQKAATTGKTDCSTRYIGEQIFVNANSNQLTITSICSNDSGVPRSINLTGILFVSNHTLTFKPLSQGVDIDTSDPLQLDYMDNSNTYRIEISKSGSIKSIGKI